MITDVENIRAAFYDARSGKSKKPSVRRCEERLDEACSEIREMLVNKTYRTSPYRTMIIHEPKTRLIFNLPFFPDRIIHHALMRVVQPIWERLFISDSYACIRGKGLHSGSRKTMEYVRKYKYCLKLDISKFYPSVDHDILFRIIQRKIKCPDTLRLFREIVYSVPDGKNVPIGNYTSQWMGNLYLNELDQYLKREHGIKAYIRYCDDFCLFHDDKKYLGYMAEIIRSFLTEHLKLTLSKCDLFPVSRGVDFLGYRHFHDHILLRKSTAVRIRRRLKKLPTLFFKGLLSQEQCRSVLASVSGWLRWANTHHYQLRLKIDELRGLFENGGGLQASVQ
jgi:retron-type reverse transcriptase